MPRPRGSFSAPEQADMFASAPPVEEKPGRKWTDEQQAIFADRKHGDDDVIVEARAGTGKTTTIVQAMASSGKRGRKLLTAFNVSAQRDLQTKLGEAGVASAEARTLNSLGYGACYQQLGRVEVDEDKGFMIAMDLVGNEKQKAAPVSKLARLGKITLASTLEELEDLADRFDIDCPFGQPDKGLLAKAALAAMEAAKQKLETIDFDDQLWLPWVFDLNPKGFDEVYCDEVQDLNPAQVDLVLKARRRGARFCAIGDPMQAIYGWRAADDAMGKIRERLGARTLKLTTTFRCARRIVDEARKLVPDYRSMEGAPDGVVEEVPNWTMRKRARPGDFVLSRANAPLVGLCIAFAKEGRRASVQGRDIGAKLQTIVKKSKAGTPEELRTWVDDWKAKEVKRLEARGRSTDLVTDAAACIHAFCEGARSVQEVTRIIDDAFDDDPSKGDKIVLSTVHRAKGLERDRVWLLKGTFKTALGSVGRGGEFFGGEQEKLPTQEELNILYVAITRAKRELYYVT